MFIVVVPSVEKQEHYEIFFFSLASFVQNVLQTINFYRVRRAIYEMVNLFILLLLFIFANLLIEKILSKIITPL